MQLWPGSSYISIYYALWQRFYKASIKVTGTHVASFCSERPGYDHSRLTWREARYDLEGFLLLLILALVDFRLKSVIYLPHLLEAFGFLGFCKCCVLCVYYFLYLHSPLLLCSSSVELRNPVVYIIMSLVLKLRDCDCTFILIMCFFT